MIIEQMKIDGPKDIFLVHYNLKDDSYVHVQDVAKWLSTVPTHSVLIVPNGQPGPTNPLPKITIYDADNDVLLGAI